MVDNHGGNQSCAEEETARELAETARLAVLRAIHSQEN
jgi:hypothetical protein